MFIPVESNRKLSKEEIQKTLDQYYTLEISLSGDVLNASARQKIDMLLNESGLSISFKIYAPKTASSILKTSHGNIDLTGLEGNEDAETSHGDINISKITGKLVGQTSHGNVSVTDCNNDIDVSTEPWRYYRQELRRHDKAHHFPRKYRFKRSER